MRPVAAIPALVVLLASPVRSADPEEFLPAVASLELSSGRVRPGGEIRMDFEFTNDGAAAGGAEHGVFVHLRPALPGDPDVPPAAGGDFLPDLPTFRWVPGTVVREAGHILRVPGDFPPGRYALLAGIFDPLGGERLRLGNEDLHAGARRYRLATVEVAAEVQPPEAAPVSRRFRDTAGLPAADDAPLPAEREPPIELRSGEVRVLVSATTPRVIRYERPDGSGLPGDTSGFPVRARIQRSAGEGGAARMVVLSGSGAFRAAAGPREVRYSAEILEGGQAAVGFEVVLRLEGDTLRASVERVREGEGWFLVDVSLPQLVAARAPAGTLAIPTQSGRLVALDRSGPGRHVVRLDWFETGVCGAVADGRCAAAIRTRDPDVEMEARIGGPAGRLGGGFAPRLALRAPAREKGAWIRLAEAPSVEVSVTGDLDGDGKADWVDAAKRLRRDLRGSPNDIYADSIIYKIFCDSPGADEHTTFDEALGLIRRVRGLAPWLKQVAYLVGWQYRGHDTGYPATDRINARLGGIEGLRRLLRDAAALDATVSFHDNFDDAYPDSPAWDEDVIARDERGDLRKGGVWAGGQSYILAPAKYARKSGIERVRQTAERLGVRGTYHIDVLSAVPVRRDHRPEAPESTADSIAGKLAIIAEFNRLGIDVTSEGFTDPFVGAIGHAWHFWARPDPVLPGDEWIPFVPMIHHGGPTTYGHGGGGPGYPAECALLGATYSSDWTEGTDSRHIAEMVYLVVLPWTHLRDRKMESFRRAGGVVRIDYGPGSFVEVREGSDDWRVVVDGIPVIDDGLAVARRPGMVVLYSRTARRAEADLPGEWGGRPVRAVDLLSGGELTAARSAGKVEVDLPAGAPVMVTLTDE